MKEIESQAPVIQMLDSAIHWRNRYLGNQLHCPLDRNLSNGWCYLAPIEQLGAGGPFLKSPGNFSGLKSKIQIEI